MQKRQAERDALVKKYVAITRKWIESDDPNIEKQRNALVYKMRAQFFLLVSSRFHRMLMLVALSLMVPTRRP